MNWARLTLDFIVGSVLSGLVFCMVSFATVMWCISPWSGMAGSKIEIGFPVKFYYLYIGQDLHGFDGNVFLKEVLVYWTLITLVYVAARRNWQVAQRSSGILDRVD